MSDHKRVTYKGRSYLVLWINGRAQVSVEFERWTAMGGRMVSRSVKPGPTRDAVLKLARP